MERRMRNYTYRQVELMNALRKLWEQHIMWTRSFIISTAENLPDLQYVTERLLRNPKDFANALRPLYGENIANEFEKMFTDHLLIAADLVNAAKAGDTDAANEARKKWYKNADDIAAFLARINPYWNMQEWQKMLYDHLKMTENEAASYLQNKFEESIKQYDDIETEALRMADYTAMGIIKQKRIM